jgi:hypothetical protein
MLTTDPCPASNIPGMSALQSLKGCGQVDGNGSHPDGVLHEVHHDAVGTPTRRDDLVGD